MDSLVGTWCIMCSSYSCKHSPSFSLDCPKLAFLDSDEDSSHPVVVACGYLRLRVCSFNCLSLVESQKAREKGLDVTGRISYLRGQCIANNVSVLGLQETRTDAGTHCSGDFIIVSSGCSGGATTRCHGLELWFHVGSWTFVDASGHESTCKLSSKDLVTIHATPRILLVSCKIGGKCVYVLNGHAPCRSHGESVCRKWWSELSDVMGSSVPKDATILATFDANGRVGLPSSSCIGDNYQSEQDINGSLLHLLGLQWHLFAPSTFLEYHDGSDQNTFHIIGAHPAG